MYQDIQMVPKEKKYFMNTHTEYFRDIFSEYIYKYEEI